MDVEEFLSYCLLQFCAFMPCSCHLHRCFYLSMSNLLSSLSIKHYFTYLTSNILLLPPFSEAPLCRVDKSVLIHPQPRSPLLKCWALLEHPQTSSLEQFMNTLPHCLGAQPNSITPSQYANNFQIQNQHPLNAPTHTIQEHHKRLFHHSCHVH